MITRCAGLILALFSISCLHAQVEIPAAYKTVLPYHIGHTVYEIDRGGERKFLKTIKINIQELDASGQGDASSVIQSYLDDHAVSADTFVTVILPPGKFRILNTLRMSSNTVLKGAGSSTILLLETGENRHGISISPGAGSIFEFQLQQDVARGSDRIVIDQAEYQQYLAIYGALKYITLQKLDDDKLLTSDWAKGCIREHFYVRGVELTGSQAIIIIGHPLSDAGNVKSVENVSMPTRSAFGKGSTRVYAQPFIENAGVECMQLVRVDSTVSQTSNIYLDQAYNCVIKAVGSRQTNFSHICISNSAFNLVKRCDISRSHGYGGGGRGYGIVMQMGSTSNVVMDNHLDRLRHSILLQAGANGNITYGNWSVNSFWQESGLPEDAAGDIVLHGNYVYSNLFEMNNVQQVVIDNSHGRNGPFNMFFRNRINNYGLLMSATNGNDSQVFVGNEITNPGLLKGLYILKDNGHFEYGNKVKSAIIPSGSNAMYPSFMWRPDCKSSPDGLKLICFPETDIPPYGSPFHNSDDSLPAAKQQIDQCDAFYDKQLESVTSNIAEIIVEVLPVYPNPADKGFWVECAETGVLSMYDGQGKCIRKWPVEAGTNSCDIHDLAPGIYILILHQHSGNALSSRIIVQ